MSFFKKLLKGAALGALVGLTGGLALGALGITSIGGIAVASLAKLATWGAVYGGLQGAALGLVKKPDMNLRDVEQRLNIRIDPAAQGKWVFGQTAAAGDIVYNEQIGDEAVLYIVAAAAHPIEEFGRFWINDEEITFDGNGVATGDWAGVLTVKYNTGADDQTALTFTGSQWPSTARGRGIAHYGLLWNLKAEKAQEKLRGGIPTRITQEIKGARVYDPRRDSTQPGGSGAHRVNDPDTWEWSANWALITAHYLLGHYLNGKLVYGMGKPAAAIDWVQTAAMADVCDEVLDDKPKYRIGGLFPTNQNHEYVISQLESAIGAKVSKFGGQYFMWVPHDDLDTDEVLTDADILSDSGVQFQPAGPVENLFNAVRGQYISPEQLYQAVPYPVIEESAAITQDGGRRLMEQSFSLIQDVEIAQRVAREMVRRTRFSGSATIICGPSALRFRPFDVVKLNTQETDNEDELFRIVSMKYSLAGAVLVQLLEEDASIYDVTAPLGTSLTQLNPGSFDPTQAIAVANLAAQDFAVNNVGGTATDAILLTWDDPGGFVDFTEINFQINGANEWASLRAAELTSGLIVPAQADALYAIRVRHWSITGVPGPWSELNWATGNATFDRLSFLGIDDPIDPLLYITLNPERGLAQIRVSARYAPSEFAATPDRLLIFYSVADVPNRLRVTEDTGSRLYLSTAIGDGVTALFNLTVAAGSSPTTVVFAPDASVDIDTSGNWWASIRNEPGSPSRYYNVTRVTANRAISFAPDVNLGLTPVAGQLIDLAELDFVDGRVGEFRMAYLDKSEVVRHTGINYDGSRYYLDVAARAAEGTAQINATGKALEYYPAPGPGTHIIEIAAGDFTESDGVFYFSGEVAVTIPVSFQWAAVTCCLARAVEVEGRTVYLRSNIVDLEIAGAA